MRKSLSLKREALAPLTPAEMSAVAGGSHESCGISDACTELVTHGLSFDSCPTPTLPVNVCLDRYTHVQIDISGVTC